MSNVSHAADSGDEERADNVALAPRMTLRAVRALQSADVILFDDGVSRGVLDFGRREATKISVGKNGLCRYGKGEDIDSLMTALAKNGKRVVRLLRSNV